MFVHSCDGVYEIGHNNLELAIKHEEPFYAHKIVKCESLILEISSLQGIRLYSVDFNLNLQLRATVTQYHNHTLHSADAFYRNNTLYVLDHNEGLLIFKEQFNSFVPHTRFQLQLEESIQYRALAL